MGQAVDANALGEKPCSTCCMASSALGFAVCMMQGRVLNATHRLGDGVRHITSIQSVGTVEASVSAASRGHVQPTTLRPMPSSVPALGVLSASSRCGGWLPVSRC